MEPTYCPYPDCNCPIDKTTICVRGLPENPGADEGLLNEAKGCIYLCIEYSQDAESTREWRDLLSRIDANLARSAT